MKEYRIVLAETEGGVLAAAAADGFTVLNPIHEFSEVDTLDDTSLGDIGRVFTNSSGFIALALKE